MAGKNIVSSDFELRKQVVITGANGFVGAKLLAHFSGLGISCVGVSRRPDAASKLAVGPELGPDSDWSAVLCGCTHLVHAAGLAHVRGRRPDEMRGWFRKVNVEGTLKLALDAAKLGVKRFIFISSIGVNGSPQAQPFTEAASPVPVEPYAVSKYEAEIGLQEVQENSGMEVVIVRPPLIYGAEAPGNFGRLLKLVASGIPLPVASIRNRRSLIAVHNLVTLIHECTFNDKAAGELFVASDYECVSTRELVTLLYNGMGMSARIFPVPADLIVWSGRLLGQSKLATQLLTSLQVDASKARRLLGWYPEIPIREGLMAAAHEFARCGSISKA